MKLTNWQSVEASLPPIGQRVYVRGHYVPPNTGLPIAYRRLDAAHARDLATYGARPRDWRWESNEWRGSVAITHWHEIPNYSVALQRIGTTNNQSTAQP